MRKFFMLVCLAMAFGAVAAQAQVPVDTATPAPVRTITLRGSGGYIINADGSVTICPNPSTAICAIQVDDGDTTVITVFGKGGAHELPGGGAVYCPDPSTDTCTTVKFPTPVAIGIGASSTQLALPLGAGQIRVYNPDHSVMAIRRNADGAYETARTGGDSRQEGRLY